MCFKRIAVVWMSVSKDTMQCLLGNRNMYLHISVFWKILTVYPDLYWEKDGLGACDAFVIVYWRFTITTRSVKIWYENILLREGERLTEGENVKCRIKNWIHVFTASLSVLSSKNSVCLRLYFVWHFFLVIMIFLIYLIWL